METENKGKVTETLESTVKTDTKNDGKGNNKTVMIVAIILGLLLLCCCVVMTIVIVIPALNTTKSDTNDIIFSTTTPTNSPSTGVTTTTGPTATTTPKVSQSAGVGDVVTKGDFEWKVLSAKNLGDTLTSTNQFIDPKKSSGNWISVRFEIKNVGSSAAYLVDPKIIDSTGIKYEKSTDSFFYVPNDEYAVFEKINPGISKTYTNIYDIPKTSTGLQLLVGDGLIVSGVKINLGL